MLSSIDDVIYEANLVNIADEEVISVHLDTASLVVKRMIGLEFYTILETERGAGTIRFQEVKKAETNYAVSFALMSLNIITTGNGIVNRFDSSKSGEYNLAPAEVEAMITHYKSLAEQFITPYILGGEENPGTSISTSETKQVADSTKRISAI